MPASCMPDSSPGAGTMHCTIDDYCKPVRKKETIDLARESVCQSRKKGGSPECPELERDVRKTIGLVWSNVERGKICGYIFPP